MNEVEVKAIALFFYFAFLSERRAIDASMEALSLLNEIKSKKPDIKSMVAFVAATDQVWEKNKTKITRGRINVAENTGWILQSQVELGPWREFQKHATYDELVILIWSKILKISDQEIAEGLSITNGTVRYRLGRALRKLGGMV